jgi:hypothetical protein
MISASALVGSGYFGPVSSAGRQVLQRIFVTVRDREWREIVPQKWECEVHDEDRRATITARHTSQSLDFEWNGELQFSPNEQGLEFSIRGKALRDMEVCRLGLVILHPLPFMIGAQVHALGPGGEQSFMVEKEIYPQRIVDRLPTAMTEPFTQLRIERTDFGVLELNFEGELFEMEDQRNWGDASFKTYCNPLRMGYPRSIAEGTTIAQRVQVLFTPAKARSRAATSRVPGTAPEWVSRVVAGRFPAIGREWVVESHKLSPARAMWDHVHVDIPSNGRVHGLAEVLTEPAGTQFQLGIGIESGNGFSSDLVEILSSLTAGISRVLLFGPGVGLPSTRDVNSFRDILRQASRTAVPVLAATRGHYVELNRGLPYRAPVSGVAFPLTGTVHNDDAGAIGENVLTIRDMAHTARHLFGRDDVVVTPLALNYPRREPQEFPQKILAPWLAATLIHAAIGEVTAITLGKDVLSALAEVRAGYTRDFLEDLTQCAGAHVDLLDTAVSQGLHAAMLTTPQQGRRILAANVAAHSRVLSLAGVGVPSGPGRDALTRDPVLVRGVNVTIPAWSVVWFGRTRVH